MEPQTDRPIPPDAWEFEIVGLHYERPLERSEESFIDLTLKRGDELRRFRFLSPQDVEVEKGFPRHTHGLVILDVSGRQLEGIGVLVDNAENCEGGVRFWARTVLELEARP